MSYFAKIANFVGICILSIAWAVVHVAAAEFDKIELPRGNHNYPDLITIKGEIVRGDADRFVELIGDSQNVTVILESPGGLIREALTIGAEVRMRNFATMVAANTQCYSACALVWVAGARRYMDEKSEIGFHAAYREVGGELVESGMANAEIGSFLTHLGLRIEAIRYFTFAGPKDYLLLSPSDARALGIDVFQLDGSNVTTPINAPSVDQYAKRFVNYASMMSRCTRYLQIDEIRLRNLAADAAETGQSMVADEMWVELWMREMEVQKQRFSQFPSLSICLDLEEDMRRQNLDTGFEGPSFDCRKASTATERAICREPALWAPDRASSAIYFWIMDEVDRDTRARVRSGQRDWLAYRNDCAGNTQCLMQVYDDRMKHLSDIEMPN